MPVKVGTSLWIHPHPKHPGNRFPTASSSSQSTKETRHVKVECTMMTVSDEGMPSSESLIPQKNDCLLVKLLRDEAKLPQKGSKGAIGFDLYAMKDTSFASKT